MNEREFTAQTADGALVGWLNEAPGKPNALLLHGGPGMSEYLDSLARELDGLVTTARYQQRGLAPSVVSGDKTVEGSVADAVAVMDALGWERPLVVGHSWGGYLAMHVGAARQDRVGGLVILDTLGAVGDGGIAAFGPNLKRGLTEAQLDRLDELASQEDNDEPLTQDERREHLGILWPNYFGDPAKAPPMPEFRFGEGSDQTWASIMGHFQEATLEHLLPTVTVPTLVIHGAKSPIPVDEAYKIVNLMPNAKLVVVEGRGHWPWLEEPGIVRQTMADWLAKATPLTG